jgi:hypothetical protein
MPALGALPAPSRGLLLPRVGGDPLVDLAEQRVVLTDAPGPVVVHDSVSFSTIDTAAMVIT